MQEDERIPLFFLHPSSRNGLQSVVCVGPVSVAFVADVRNLASEAS